jgi:HAL2 family 3'(2'),5'-bisphosphate nucleotidase
MKEIFTPELLTGIEMVREASLLSVRIQKELTSTAVIKKDRSPVTVADFSVQALIAWRLEEQFPQDVLVGEEDGSFLQEQDEALAAGVTSYVQSCIPDADQQTVAEWINRGNAEPGERFWLVDPIDGTKGFLRGGQFAVALSLLVDYQVSVGLLGCPNIQLSCFEKPGVVIYAAAGKGTWALPLDGSREALQLSVSACSSGADARMLFSFESAHTNVGVISAFLEKMGIVKEPVRIDSQAKQGLLAAGDGEFLLRVPPADAPEYKEKIWDQAAGMLVIEEAGGRVTDLDGKPLDYSAGRKLENNRGVLCSNGVLHDEALEVLSGLYK